MGKGLAQGAHGGRAAFHPQGWHLLLSPRLPDHLGTDVALSLGTRRYSEAEHLAGGTRPYIFGSAVSAVTSPADLRGILRAYLEDALEDDTTMHLDARPGRPVYGGLVGEERDMVDTGP